MGERYLLDSNTIIYYLDGNLPVSALDFLDVTLRIEGIVSVISKIELLSWNTLNISDYAMIERFIHHASIYGLNDEIVARTIALRKTHKI